MYVTIFVKGFLVSNVSCRVPSLHRIRYGTYTGAALLWMCAIKRRLPSHPRLMVILLGEIEGFSFPAKKSVDGLPPPSPHPPSQMRHLAGIFFRPSDVPQETTTSTRAFRFSDGFFDKAPETTGRSVVGSTTITID